MTLPGFQREGGDLALVLAGGGARAAYQVGVLCAIAEHRPDLRIPIVTGVSAGAINASYVCAHQGNFGQATRSLREEWERLTPPKVYKVRPISLFRAGVRWALRWAIGRRAEPGSVQGLMDLSPLRTFLESCMSLEGIERNIESGRLRAAALSATSYTTGQTVTFMQAAHDIPVWQRVQRIGVRAPLTIDHVLASASIPIIFPAVRLPDGFYGDGSVRQIAPLAPAIHLGATKILAITMRSARAFTSVPVHHTGEYPSTAEVIGLIFNAVFLDSLDADAERLERLNRLLQGCGPDEQAPGALRPISLLLLRPSRDLGVMSRGHAKELPQSIRWVVNSIGGRRAKSSDFVSYLLFEPSYTKLLMELGYEDASADWETIDAFLEA